MVLPWAISTLPGCPQRVETLPDSNCTNQILSQESENMNRDDKYVRPEHVMAWKNIREL